MSLPVFHRLFARSAAPLVLRRGVPRITTNTCLNSASLWRRAISPLPSVVSASRLPLRSGCSDSSSADESVFDPEALNVEDKATYDELLEDIRIEPIVLFMKGEAQSPRCGYSARAVELLGSMRYEFLTYDVLCNPVIYKAVKTISAWPTYPQLFVQGKFVGGADILDEMVNTGELEKVLQRSGAPKMSDIQVAQALPPEMHNA